MRQDEYQFWVYILSSRSRTLYVGMTDSLRKRIVEHRRQTPGTFTTRYNVTRVVYFEQFQYVNNAIAREEELKKWTRAQKIALIDAANPTWEDLMPEEPESAFFKADSLRE